MVHGGCDNSSAKPATVSELWEAQDKRTTYAKRVLEIWAETKSRTGTGREIDGLLMPCSPWPASEKSVPVLVYPFLSSRPTFSGT